MDVRDLLSDPMLRLELATPSGPEELSQQILSAVATESMDPSGYLAPKTLLITTGMALNVTDQRIWNGYVERLVARRAAALAFGTGKAHPQVPDGLLVAARTMGLPVLVVPDDVPFLRLQQHVSQTLAEERFALARRAWALAEECTMMATAGADFLAILRHLSLRLDVSLTVVDDARAPFVTAGPEAMASPEAARRPGAPSAEAVPRRARNSEVTLEIPLPVGGAETWFLTARGNADEDLRTLLTPASAALGMSLSSRMPLAGGEDERSRALARALLRTDAEAPRAVADALSALGLRIADGVHAVVVTARSRLRQRLIGWRLMRRLSGTENSAGGGAVAVEVQDRIVVLMPARRGTGAGLRAELESFARTGAGDSLVITAATTAPADLVFSVLALVQAPEARAGIHEAPAIDLAGLTSFLPPVVREALPRVRLARLLGRSDTAELIGFLRAMLQEDSLNATAVRLGVHRNTVRSHRRRLESLLGVDLDATEDRAMCALALAVLDADATS